MIIYMQVSHYLYAGACFSICRHSRRLRNRHRDQTQESIRRDTGSIGRDRDKPPSKQP